MPDNARNSRNRSDRRRADRSRAARYERLRTPMVRDAGGLRPATNEVNYLAQKLVRQGFGTNNIDSCNRT
jgi:hypothetical protein